jgi:hypothetical protein
MSVTIKLLENREMLEETLASSGRIVRGGCPYSPVKP